MRTFSPRAHRLLTAVGDNGCDDDRAHGVERRGGRAGARDLAFDMIGGIASHASTAEVRGFVRAAVASLYDAPITSAEQWRQLRPLRRT
jgi:hypothetical protein